MNLHREMSESIVIFLGQQFATDDETYNFYSAYVRNRGFGVRKKISHGGLLMKLFVDEFFARLMITCCG